MSQNKIENNNNNQFTHRFAVLGGGNMGFALIKGFIKSNLVKPEEIIIYDTDSSKYDSYIMSGLHVAESTTEAVRDAEYTIIAVKPSVVQVPLTELSKNKKVFENSTFISIAAAVPMDYICEKIGMYVPIIRTMPSTPMLIGKGAIAVCKNDLVAEEKFSFVCNLFSSIAEMSVMDESGLNSIIAINGSSPAYVYLFIKAMLDGAMEQGISKEQALPLILQTIEGSVGMVRDADVGIEELIQNVASPKGTTLAALNSFYQDDFEGAVKRAMQACTKRADEISAELRA